MKKLKFSFPLLHWLVAGLLSLVLVVAVVAIPLRAQSQEQIFEQVWQTVNDHFFDPKFNGVDWGAIRQKYRPQVAQARSQVQVSALINQMLGELRTSHTRFYTPQETAYYQLLGIFQPSFNQLPTAVKKLFPDQRYEYVGIGAMTRQILDEIYVSGVLEGSPAAAAGVRVGDKLLRVEGQPFQAIESFQGRAGKPLKLTVQRTAEVGKEITLTVTPKTFETTTMFVDAQKASTQITEQGGKKLGYVHIWSNAADPGQEQLIEDLTRGRLAQADGLVLDIRDGWGGGSTGYLNVFTGEGPSITSINRKGQQFTYSPQWRKPVVLLINQGSRSAKEIFAYGFQRYRVGPLVGTPTAGAVVAGRPYFMNDGSMLYLAVADVRVDGERLEGKGVAPEINVPFALPYAAGADPQLERARAELLSLINRRAGSYGQTTCQ